MDVLYYKHCMNIRAFSWATLLCLTTFYRALFAGLLDTGTIRIANKTDQNVYCTFYYQQGTKLTRATSAQVLPADNAMTICLPKSQFFSTRVLALSRTAHPAESTTTSTHQFLVPVQRVGLWQADDVTLHLPAHHTTLQLVSTQQWHADQKRHEHYKEHAHTFAYADHVATVNTHLLDQDRAYLIARQEQVLKEQESLLGISLKRPLRIGIVSSGGGFRSMTATMGLLMGLKDIGLLDMALSCAGLSGSTWALMSWLVSQQAVTDYAQELSTRLHRGLMHHLSDQYNDLARIKKEKEWCNLPVSGIDLYGVGLSHTLLKPIHTDHATLSLSDTADLLDPTLHPYLVSTAAVQKIADQPYTWSHLPPLASASMPTKNVYSVMGSRTHLCQWHKH